MKRLIAAFLIFALSATPLYSQAVVNEKLEKRAKQAVALLYSQDASGGMHMHCTMTAFEKTEKGYLFATAAHCVGEDEMGGKEKSAKWQNTSFFMTFDNPDSKVFYPAEVRGVGFQHRGDDFAIFEVKTTDKWTTIALGDEKKEEDGNAVINVASPLGLGKQVYRGVISSLDLDRPIVEGDINWRHSIGLQIAADGGSSGSAVISVDQGKIVAFLVGTVGGAVVIAIPVSKFIAFKAAVDAGTYKYFDKEP